EAERWRACRRERNARAVQIAYPRRQRSEIGKVRYNQCTSSRSRHRRPERYADLTTVAGLSEWRESCMGASLRREVATTRYVHDRHKIHRTGISDCYLLWRARRANRLVAEVTD